MLFFLIKTFEHYIFLYLQLYNFCSKQHVSQYNIFKKKNEISHLRDLSSYSKKNAIRPQDWLGLGNHLGYYLENELKEN